MRYYVRRFEFDWAFVQRTDDIHTAEGSRIHTILSTVHEDGKTVITALVEAEQYR